MEDAVGMDRLRLPPPPKEIRDQRLENNFSDIIGVHQAFGRDGNTMYILTMGCKSPGVPAQKGQETTEYDTFIAKDYLNLTDEEWQNPIFIPGMETDTDTRALAAEFHQLLSYTPQLTDITSEKREQLEQLFREASTGGNATHQELISQARQILTGDLVLNEPDYSKEKLTKLVKRIG